MFQFALRKMRQNRWLALSLLAGYLMAVAIVCSMPVYSHAILSRMLLKDLEQVQTSQNVYPGRLLADTDLYEGSKDPVVKTQAYHQYETQFQELIAETGLPMQEFSVYTEAGDLRVVRAGTAMEDIHDLYKSGGLGACTGLFDQVELLDGAFPSAEAKDGVIEAVVSEEAARNLDCSLGTSYDLYQYQLIMKQAAPMGLPIAPLSISSRQVWMPAPRYVSGAPPSIRPFSLARATSFLPSSKSAPRGFSE